MLVFELTYSRLVKLVLLNPVFLVLVCVSAVMGAVIVAVLLRDVPAWRAAAMVLFMLLVPIVPLLILTPSRIGYGADGCSIVVEYYKTYRIPAQGANITLLPYEKVKPVFRVAGIALPGLSIGRYKFANGKYGVAIIFGHSDKALVISYGDNYFVISHPGVEKAYRDLLEALRRHGCLGAGS